MTQKLSKKGRNPGAVDSWLETLGYYRKNVAYDETCLFRAVSEQLFNIQIYHEKIRTECIDYARNNLHEFSGLIKSRDLLLDHIEKLEKHMVICGTFEIHMISKMYKCDIDVFNASKQEIDHIVDMNQEKKVLLCLMNDDHYDAVYRAEYIAAAGFAQSIAYKLLYENVFHIPKVDEIVYGMLFDKTYITTSQTEELRDRKEPEQNESEETGFGDSAVKSDKPSLNIAPFPFKVAKALDPSMYRNIEYDSWTEVRREMRLGDWYYGDDKLILGTRCILNDQSRNETLDCYIQDIIKNENKCVVYVTKFAEKRIVNYTDLSPEDNAKPWPLPYRFTKSLHVSAPLTILSLDKIKAQKKKKEKNRMKIETSNNSALAEGTLDADLNAFLGAPLHMQSVQNVKEDLVDLTEVSPIPSPQDAQNKDSRFQWDTPYYSFSNVVTPLIQEPFSWPGTPVSPAVFNFNIRPVMTPTTPNVMPYCDLNQSPMYNYPMESYGYQYPSWNQQSELQQSPGLLEPNPNSQKPQNEEAIDYYQDPNMDQSMVCSPVPRVNPPMGIYSPIIPVPPVTPVIYSPPAEIMMPNTPLPHMYEMPYLVPESYTYSPTPPPWYPVGVNSQGFIFPPPNGTSVVKPH